MLIYSLTVPCYSGREKESVNKIKDSWSWHFSFFWEISALSCQELFLCSCGSGTWLLLLLGIRHCSVLLHIAAFPKLFKAIPQEWRRVPSKLAIGKAVPGPRCFVVPQHLVGGHGHPWDCGLCLGYSYGCNHKVQSVLQRALSNECWWGLAQLLPVQQILPSAEGRKGEETRENSICSLGFAGPWLL